MSEFMSRARVVNLWNSSYEIAVTVETINALNSYLEKLGYQKPRVVIVVFT